MSYRLNPLLLERLLWFSGSNQESLLQRPSGVYGRPVLDASSALMKHALRSELRLLSVELVFAAQSLLLPSPLTEKQSRVREKNACLSFDACRLSTLFDQPLVQPPEHVQREQRAERQQKDDGATVLRVNALGARRRLNRDIRRARLSPWLQME